MARTMLCESNLPKYFWAEAISTACHILNRVLIRPITKKTPYELWKNKKPTAKYLRVFGCRCFILNNGKEDLSKFDAKSDEGIFLGYSTSSRAYRVFNKRTLVVEESVNIIFDESDSESARKENILDDDAGIINFEKLNIDDVPIQDKGDDCVPPQSQNLPKEWRYAYGHPKDLIIGDPSQGVRTRSSLKNLNDYLAFVSQLEPKTYEEAEKDTNWINAMQEELNQFKRSNVWTLTERPEHNSVIGTK